jgi:hypothetical protein
VSVQVLEDEVDKKAREIRDRMRRGELGADRTEVQGKDPGKHYRWINNRQRGMAARKAQGYDVVDPKSKVKAPHGYVRDGAITLGEDLVLAETSHDKYIERLAMSKVKAERFEVGAVEEAKENINRLYRDEMRGKPHKDITFEEDK